MKTGRVIDEPHPLNPPLRTQRGGLPNDFGAGLPFSRLRRGGWGVRLTSIPHQTYSVNDQPISLSKEREIGWLVN